MRKLALCTLLFFRLISFSQNGYEVILFETSVDEFDVFGNELYEKNNRTSVDITEKLMIRATSSSKSDPVDFASFEAKNLIDGNMKSCWMSSKSFESDMIELIIDLEENETVKSAIIHNIYFVNGWRKDLQTWKDYSRIKKASVYINDMPYGEITFANTYKFQSIDLEKYKIEKEKRYRFRFKILEVYKGDKSEQVALSDIQFIGKIK